MADPSWPGTAEQQLPTTDAASATEQAGAPEGRGDGPLPQPTRPLPAPPLRRPLGSPEPGAERWSPSRLASAAAVPTPDPVVPAAAPRPEPEPEPARGLDGFDAPERAAAQPLPAPAASALPPVVETGHPAVDTALARLAVIHEVPAEARTGVYGEVHELLRDTLAGLEERAGQAPTPLNALGRS